MFAAHNGFLTSVPVFDVVVYSGTSSPDVGGTYAYAGQYSGRNYYRRGTDAMYMWSDGTTYWKITVILGNSSSWRFYNASNTALPPLGVTWPVNGGGTGTATT